MQGGVSGLLRGSAVCTWKETVCLDPECSAVGKSNMCRLSQRQAYFDLSMTILLLILVAVVSSVQNNVSAALDESLQTAQDYSVLIFNYLRPPLFNPIPSSFLVIFQVLVDDPGPEDFDPDEWQQFFSQFGHVTFVTVAKNNGPLLTALAKRRAIMREIIMMLGNGEVCHEEDDDGVLDSTWKGLSFVEKVQAICEEETQTPVTSADRTRGFIMATGAFGMKKLR